MKKSLDRPDETIEIAGLRQDLVRVGDFTVGRVVHPDGWRWSQHLKPVVGGAWCMSRHVGIVLEGRMRLEFKDGTELDVEAGEVFDVPPGHDAYSVGSEQLVTLDWAGLDLWTRARANERVLTGLLMTDIVGSTSELVRVGDAVWRQRLAEHHESLRALLDKFAGREVDTAGDGMLAVFDGAARAVQCAVAIRDAAAMQDLDVRIGVHVGEVELTEHAVRGVAVHETARIAACAGAGEILVSETTRALTEGAGLRFIDRGAHQLKGLGPPRTLFAYDAPSLEASPQ